MNSEPQITGATPPETLFPRTMLRIEDLVHEIEHGPDPRMRDQARQLTQALLDLHRSGLEKIWTLLERSGDAGEPVRSACLEDPLLSSLLVLHDLHPVDSAARLAQALERVRPQLQGHGGDVELVSFVDDVVHLRLVGKCDGCPSAGQTMRNLVENALCESAADITSIFWDNSTTDRPPQVSGFVPLESFGKW